MSWESSKFEKHSIYTYFIDDFLVRIALVSVALVLFIRGNVYIEISVSWSLRPTVRYLKGYL